MLIEIDQLEKYIEFTDDDMRNCDNCGTPITTGCSWYTAGDCGPDYSLWTPKDE